MSYGLIYTLPFRDIRQKLYTFKVEQEGYTGQAVELKGQPSPFTVTISEDSNHFLYTPLLFSTATLHIFGSDYLQSLFSTDYRMNRVTLYDGSTPVWCGYVKPEVYTQDFRHVKFPLDIECYSAMSVLEFLDFKQQGDTRGFISLWDLIKLCVKGSGGLYSAIYVPHTYAKTSSDYDNWVNPLTDMVVSQQNFFDEDDNAMTLKEVLESVMKLLNWTCVDWRGELYFIDADGTGEYYKYTSDFASYTKVNADKQAVQDIGYSGANHTLDILPGYNKVVINCSNYPVGDALPSTEITDADYLVTKDEKYYQSVTQGYRVERYKIYRPTNAKFELNAYKMGDTVDSVTLLSRDEEKEYIESSGDFMPGKLTGAIAWKYAQFNLDKEGNADVIDLDYTEEINIKTRRDTHTDVPVFSAENKIPIIRVKGVTSAYSGGAFAINFNAVLNGVYGSYINTWDFHFQLRIGNKYYHGKGDDYVWDSNPETDAARPNNLNVQLDSAASGGDFSGVYPVVSNRKMDDGLEGVDGFVCRLPDNEVLFGDLEFTIYAPAITTNISGEHFTSVGLRDFSFGYNKYTTDGEDTDTDRIYENVINENYINQLDDIEFKISSYNNDGACYSKVLLGDTYLTDNLYNGITLGNARLENFLIRRIINHYESTKYLLTLELKKGDIKPFTTLTDSNTAGKKYINVGGEIDYKQDSFTCKLLEHEAGSSN